jgi:hypothetical protein
MAEVIHRIGIKVRRWYAESYSRVSFVFENDVYEDEVFE